MKNVTSEEERRLWKLEEPPIRRILLWGFDSQKNPCLLILYGKQEIERELRKSPRSYYPDAYVLKPMVGYTHYAVFHGVNGHLPSIPNTHYCEEKNVLCYSKGYKTAHRYWDYNQRTGWQQYIDIDEEYIIKDFYELKQDVVFNYYEDMGYTDYAAYLTEHQIHFQDFELIQDPSVLFGFEAGSPKMEMAIHMCSGQRLYARIKYLRQWIKTQPSVEEYERILKVASVELACGIFQELTVEKNPILLETAGRIDRSGVLWASEAYHSGLKRCIRQYTAVFDEKLLQEQKDLLYQTLPEMDFHIKHLKLNGIKRKGKELQEYLERPNAYQNMFYIFGSQNLYDNNTYTDGRNVKNIAFKNAIQTAKAYGMADAIGKIAYYLDAPRTTYYFKGSGRTGAYNYYVRYLRRTLDGYLATDEAKFIAAAREMLVSYTGWDNMDVYCDDFSGNYFFNRYFREVAASDDATGRSIWRRYLTDVLFIAQNAKAVPVHQFCYALLKRAQAEHKLDAFGIKELIAFSNIPYEKTAAIFEGILLPRLEALQEFDAGIMVSLMNTPMEKLWDAAKEYFRRTNGKFQPEDIAGFLFLDTIETWYSVLEDNLNQFSVEEYTVFLKAIAENRRRFLERQIELPGQATELLLTSVGKLEAATSEEQKDLLRYFVSLLLRLEKLPSFLFDVTEQIVFFAPCGVLNEMLKDIDLRHDKIPEKEYNTIALLESCKEDALPKDSLILSILETGSKRLVKTLTEIIGRHQEALAERASALLLLLECNVYHLNQIAKSVLEGCGIGKREKLHMLVLDSPVERAYQYGLEKLDEWYGNKIPTQFMIRMMEHPCVEVKAYLAGKIKQAFSDFKDTNPDLYLYYAKTLLYLPNRVSKDKEHVYRTIPLFLEYYPQKRQEIEQMLLDIGSTNSKIDSERALVAFAQIQKEVSAL